MQRLTSFHFMSFEFQYHHHFLLSFFFFFDVPKIFSFAPSNNNTFPLPNNNGKKKSCSDHLPLASLAEIYGRHNFKERLHLKRTFSLQNILVSFPSKICTKSIKQQTTHNSIRKTITKAEKEQFTKLFDHQYLPSCFFIKPLAKSRQMTRNPTPAAPPNIIATVLPVFCPDPAFTKWN